VSESETAVEVRESGLVRVATVNEEEVKAFVWELLDEGWKCLSAVTHNQTMTVRMEEMDIVMCWGYIGMLSEVKGG